MESPAAPTVPAIIVPSDWVKLPEMVPESPASTLPPATSAPSLNVTVPAFRTDASPVVPLKVIVPPPEEMVISESLAMPDVPTIVPPEALTVSAMRIAPETPGFPVISLPAKTSLALKEEE